MKARIRTALASDSAGISRVITAAFPGSPGEDIDELVSQLLSDATANPLTSLVAEIDSRVAGHILFTGVRLENSPVDVSAQILAPLAVHPDFQRREVGGLLVREGLEQLTATGTELVFVLGHPEYYPRHGFAPAGARGFEAPYPIPDEHAGAWMVQELHPGIITRSQGQVVCANSLMDPRHWSE